MKASIFSRLGALLMSGALSLGIQRLAAQQTVGLFQYDPATTDGYTLLAPIPSTNTYLLDNCGRVVHEWGSGYTPGNAVYLLENGSLLRSCRIANNTFVAGGVGGRIQLQDWDGTVSWYYEYSNTNHSQHHDAIALPNGNIVFIAWESKTRNEAIAAGRDSLNLQQRFWPDHLIEIEPTTPGNGNIVWEWHAWDHLVQDHDSTKANFGVVSDHPELIDVNYFRAGTTMFRDWMHTNGLAYNPVLDQIAISIHNFDEIWVIDHSTTTQEAASHTGGNSGKGGDLLYRWGNPEVYDRGTTNDRLLFGMHNVTWVPSGDQYAGQFMVFNNGLGRPAGNFSTIDIWQPPVDVNGNYTLNPGQPYGPAALTWTYQDNPATDFYSQLISGAQRLPLNHTIMVEGNSGRIREIDDQGNKVWEYVNPVGSTGPLNQGDPANNNSVFRVYKFASTYPGLAGQDLTPGAPLEGNPLPLPSVCTGSALQDAIDGAIQLSPNPFTERFVVSTEGLEGNVLQVFDLSGREVLKQVVKEAKTEINGSNWPAGLYCIRIQGLGEGWKLQKY